MKTPFPGFSIGEIENKVEWKNNRLQINTNSRMGLWYDRLVIELKGKEYGQYTYSMQLTKMHGRTRQEHTKIEIYNSVEHEEKFKTLDDAKERVMGWVEFFKLSQPQ